MKKNALKTQRKQSTSIEWPGHLLNKVQPVHRYFHLWKYDNVHSLTDFGTKSANWLLSAQMVVFDCTTIYTHWLILITHQQTNTCWQILSPVKVHVTLINSPWSTLNKHLSVTTLAYAHWLTLVTLKGLPSVCRPSHLWQCMWCWTMGPPCCTPLPSQSPWTTESGRTGWVSGNSSTDGSAERRQVNR